MDQTTQSTNKTENHFPPTYRTALILCHSVNIILLGISLYLSLCVFTYGCKTRSWKNRHARSSGMNRGGVYTLCFIAVLLDIPRLTMTEIVININSIQGGKHNCEELVDASNIAHYIAAFPKYFFLWYRQHTIYSHPASVSTFSGNCAKLISYSVLIVMVIISALITYFYISPFSFANSPLGCVFQSVANDTTSMEQISRKSRDYILTSGLMLNELVLLSLFVYPLCRNQSMSKKLRRKESVKDIGGKKRESSATIRMQSLKSGKSKRKSKNNSLTRLIKRSTVATAVAVTADLVVMIIANVLPRNLPVVILMVIYNVRSIILSICVISTFSYYKRILVTFCVAKNKSLTANLSSFTSSRVKNLHADMYMKDVENDFESPIAFAQAQQRSKAE